MKTLSSTPRLFPLFLIFIILLGNLASPTSVHAAGIVVNSLLDTTVIDGGCTLREAIQNANDNAASNADCATGVGADTITFSVDGTITLGSTLPTIEDVAGLMIDGAGHGVTISGNHAVRVFEIGTAPVTLNNLTIANGHHNDWGGGIENNAGGTLTITRCSFTGNSAPYYGAIFNGATMTVVNSTFSGNSASKNGAAIGAKSATLTIINSTIANNTAPDIGGISVWQGTSTLRNTIVANNTGGNCSQVTPITNGGNNIDSGVTCGWGSANGSKSNTDPLLGALIGSPAYLPLKAGSPAIDAGKDAVCNGAVVNGQSQNGLARPQGVHCDIGSVEKKLTIVNFSRNSIAVQDGWISETSETSNMGGTFTNGTSTLRLGDDASRRQLRAILSFDTSGVPDAAVITSLTLKIRKQAITGGGDPVALLQGFMLDVMNGTYGVPALQPTDFQATGATTVFKTFGPYLSVPDSLGWYTVSLPATAYKYVNKLTTSSGLTQIRLRFKLDDNNNRLANFLSVYSGEAASTSRPRLMIQYYVR